LSKYDNYRIEMF